MRMRQAPPDWLEALPTLAQTPEQAAGFFRALHSPEMSVIVARANHGYSHWEKFRYWPLPDEVTPKQAWAAVCLSRQSMFQKLRLSMVDGTKLKYCTPPHHQEWLHRIDQDGGGTIAGRARSIPKDDDRFLFNSLMEEAIASSQLEGAATTRLVAKELLRTQRRPRTMHEQMIVNNYNAILEIRDLKDKPLTPELLCQIQDTITHKTLPESESGRFRHSSDKPVCVVDCRDDEVLHKAPASGHIDWMVDELCDFANEKPSPFVHPIVRAIAIHFAIGYIHPFMDGNGRTARAVFYWFMLKHGYWIFEYLPISRIILDSPGKYVRAYLYTETDVGDFTYFIDYNLRVIDRAVREMHEYFIRQHQRTLRAHEIIDAIPDLNHRQIATAYDAVRSPTTVFTVKAHAGLFRITQQTARADLNGLVAAKVLTPRQVGKRFEFVADVGIRRLMKADAFRAMPEKVKKRAAKAAAAIATTSIAESEIVPDDSSEPISPLLEQRELRFDDVGEATE